MKRLLLSPLFLVGFACVGGLSHAPAAAAQTQASGCVDTYDDYGDCVEVTIAIAGAGTEVDGYLDAANTDYFFGEVADVSAYAEIDDQDGNSVSYDNDPYEPYEANAQPYATGIRNGQLFFLYTYVGATVCYDDSGGGEFGYFEGGGGGGGGDYCYDEEEEDLLDGVYVYIDTSLPVIYQLSPNHDVLGGSSTITVSGDALVDPNNGETSVKSDDPNFNVQVTGSPQPTQVTLSYSIAANATVGTDHITFTQSFGKSDPKNFFICPAVPSITNLSQASINAGSTVVLTISGTGFGAQPTASIVGTGVSGGGSGQGSDTSVSLTVTVAKDAPNGSATITVTGTQGPDPQYCASSSTTSQITVNAVTPAPQIMFNQQSVSGTTQTVLSGQLISLSVAAPSGYTVNTQSWQLSNPNAAVGNYQNKALAGPPGADTGGTVAALPQANTGTFSFYWIVPGDTNDVVTYNYTLSNGQQASANVTFVVNGPRGVVLNTTEGVGGIYNFALAGGGTQYRASISGADGCGAKRGVVFMADESNAAPVPAGYNGSWGDVGQWSFVQLIDDTNDRELNQDGFQTCRPNQSPDPAIDTTYPYATGQYANAKCTTLHPNDTAIDSPGINLTVGDVKGALTENFKAHMYLLWTPPAATQCQAQGQQACTIPISLGYTFWTFCTGVINTLAPNGARNGWNYACANPDPNTGNTHPAFQPSTIHPTWTNNVATFAPNCTVGP